MQLSPEEQLNIIKRLKALADTGLVYSENVYDQDRYSELLKISLQLMGHISGNSISDLQHFFLPVKDYPTVKVDVRAFVLNENNELLMAQESIDQKWSIPGGWADIGDSPSEAVLKEIKEETGLDAKVERLLAVYDKRCHQHPPQPFYIYKLIFLCQITGGDLRPGFDMKGAQFFSLTDLPPLSQDRILKTQLEQLYTLSQKKDALVYFD